MEKSEPILSVVGMPLDDEGTIDPLAARALAESDFWIAETRKGAFRFVAAVPGAREKDIYFLDQSRADAMKEIQERLTRAAKEGARVGLFSDCGMPILFDPGAQVLAWCRALGFRIRSISGPTSWGTACALSGLAPPFRLVGFLPREKPERDRELARLRDSDAHCVLLETPYRFELLLKNCRDAFGPKREGFLAWEISKAGERLLWGSLDQIARDASRLGLQKGEFVLIVQAK